MSYYASRNDEMLNINGDLKSGFASPGKDYNKSQPKTRQSNLQPTSPTVKNNFKKSMVFSIEMT